MNRNFYSNIELTNIKNRLNKEIQRRGTYKWWDPLTVPSVGEDKSPPLTLPDVGERMQIDENTYAINNPSTGSIEPTRNIHYPSHGENPSGQDPDPATGVPNTSAAQFNVDEIRNYIVGLSKIQDINLFYGRDEVEHLAFRDPQGIIDALEAAESSELNTLLHRSDISATKTDPYTEQEVTYPIEDGIYVMPSGEYDGEEALDYGGLSEDNFYDDHGALPGNSNYHPYNPYISPEVHRDWNDQGKYRDEDPTLVIEGGVSSTKYDTNPRNPQQGKQYKSRPVYGGTKGACNVACTGLCHTTCDNECSESCATTCWGRCGNACTSSCGNVCTGCSSLCYTSCKTKCENVTGYSCLKAGAKAVKITAKGGKNGEYAQNTVEVDNHMCDGCSYTCQFYPNKKTECWDAGCMGKCFTSCTTSCSTSCYGGCVDNNGNDGDSYKTGTGRGCSSGCTLNCIGLCSGVCEGYCIKTCWHACKQSCSDNCTWKCSTSCGNGCFGRCTNGCTGCSSLCIGSCSGASDSKNCTGCSMESGCTATCQHDCNNNCAGQGCRSVCGSEGSGACDANCRLGCMKTACTSVCEDACSDKCTTCVNSCGAQCGPCTSECSSGCGAECNITCTERCQHSCEETCVHSCVEECGGCSNLCYSCVGMCIGVCSVKCENGCSNCTNTCGWWCDSSCNRQCFSNCSDKCINTCSGSCATFLESSTNMITGPSSHPTQPGYKYNNPSNRWEERESFKIIKPIESGGGGNNGEDN